MDPNALGPLRGPSGGRRCRLRCRLLLAVLMVLLGCSGESPKSAASAVDTPAAELLKQLTATDEGVRFAVLDTAKKQIDYLSPRETEAALTALRPKNVSTLIYVCIQTKSKLLLDLSPAAQKALEHSAGSFPNLAYYLARVDPAAGLPALVNLYERHPNQRMAICLAVGEICHPKASDFLLDQARRIKTSGGDIVAPLAGLKHACRKIDPETVDWLLAQQLNREETIALSELDLNLPPKRLQTLWLAGGRDRFLAVEVILGAPQTHFETLRWMVDQYLKAGDKNTVRELMHSDGMRSVTDKRLIEFRAATLAGLPLAK
jgi:hypothetical protein